MGERQIYSVRWQQQVEWLRTDINFAKTFEQRRLKRMLSEETACHIVDLDSGAVSL